MARYCVEADASASRFILHLQHCQHYNHTQLLVLDRLCDIGDCRNAGEALSSARRDFGGVRACVCCLAAEAKSVRAA